MKNIIFAVLYAICSFAFAQGKSEGLVCEQGQQKFYVVYQTQQNQAVGIARTIFCGSPDAVNTEAGINLLHEKLKASTKQERVVVINIIPLTK